MHGWMGGIIDGWVWMDVMGGSGWVWLEGYVPEPHVPHNAQPVLFAFLCKKVCPHYASPRSPLTAMALLPMWFLKRLCEQSHVVTSDRVWKWRSLLSAACKTLNQPWWLFV